MKKALRYITFIDLIFMLFLSVSGAIGGTLGNIMYYLAFIVSVYAAFAIKRRTGGAFCPPRLKLSKKGIGLLSVFIFPTVALIFLVSLVTSLFLTSLGVSSSDTDVSGNIVLMILTHALLPALCEEALFRYIPISIIGPYSKKWCMVLSAAFFALIHCDLFRIPYAFIAGLVFAAVDIAFDSILPSFILHFLNNTLSILWMRSDSGWIFVVIILSLAVVSGIGLIMMRRSLRDGISHIFDDKSKLELSYEPILLVVLTLLTAITNLFM